jgi:hypothetical protein
VCRERPSSLATRRSEESEDNDKQDGRQAEQPGTTQDSANGEYGIEQSRISNQGKMASTTAELAGDSSSPDRSSRRRPPERRSTDHDIADADTPQSGHTVSPTTTPPASNAGPTARPAASAPPVGVDLEGDALLSEEGLLLAQTHHLVGALAYNLALDAEEIHQWASGRTSKEMHTSAKNFASHVVALLARSSAPSAAMTDFVYWVKGRGTRSVKRDKKTGERVPLKKPGAYWTSVATNLIGEAERAQWACAVKNAEEELVNRLNAEAAAWERRAQEEQRRQAEHEEERARWSRRAEQYEAWKREDEQDEWESGSSSPSSVTSSFVSWQEEQERLERHTSSPSSVADWVGRLSEEEALEWLQSARRADETPPSDV